VKRLAMHYRRRPDRLDEEAVRAFLVGAINAGMACGTIKRVHFGLKFSYTTTRRLLLAFRLCGAHARRRTDEEDRTGRDHRRLGHLARSRAGERCREQLVAERVGPNGHRPESAPQRGRRPAVAIVILALRRRPE
jgi:hypothetical protein